MIIQDLLAKWCRMADRLQLEAIFDVFHDDAIDNHGAYNGDVAGLANWILDRHRHITFSLHQISNVFIEFIDEQTALVETTVCTIQRHAPESEGLAQFAAGMVLEPGCSYDYLSSARYIDRFENRPGIGWKIAQRDIVTGWRKIFDVAENSPGKPSGTNVQRRDDTDLIYVMRRQMGLV